MKLSMMADFKILKKNVNGEFVPMNKCQAEAVSIGGFSFDVGGNSIPFDWDAFTGAEENGIFRFYTGKGFLFNDYELSANYDEIYQDMELNRKDITAEYLASTHHIEEFFVDFQDHEPFEDDYTDVGIGCFSDNAEKDVDYKLYLVRISFKDMETEKIYDVDSEVLEAFNKGIRRELENNLNNIKGDVSMNKIEKWEIKGEFAYLTYSDSDIIKVKKEDFDRAFGPIVSAPKDAVVRDFAVKDSLADKIKQAEITKSKTTVQDTSLSVEREGR